MLPLATSTSTRKNNSNKNDVVQPNTNLQTTMFEVKPPKHFFVATNHRKNTTNHGDSCTKHCHSWKKSSKNDDVLIHKCSHPFGRIDKKQATVVKTYKPTPYTHHSHSNLFHGGRVDMKLCRSIIFMLRAKLSYKMRWYCTLLLWNE